MLTFKNILVPIDFADPSDRAFEYALELAKRLESGVTVMHSYEIPVYGFPDGAIVATAEITSRIVQASQAGLDAAKEKGEKLGVNVTPILRQGLAWEEIQKVADETHADMIIMGTHGRRGVVRALLGSVAEKVVRMSTRPVLLIRETEKK